MSLRLCVLQDKLCCGYEVCTLVQFCSITIENFESNLCCSSMHFYPPNIIMHWLLLFFDCIIINWTVFSLLYGQFDLHVCCMGDLMGDIKLLSFWMNICLYNNRKLSNTQTLLCRAACMYRQIPWWLERALWEGKLVHDTRGGTESPQTWNSTTSSWG